MFFFSTDLQKDGVVFPLSGLLWEASLLLDPWKILYDCNPDQLLGHLSIDPEKVRETGTYRSCGA